MSTEAKQSSRERLLAAVAELTYRDGVNIGVEALCKAAGVSKRSMYQLFDSKDELLAVSLERRGTASSELMLHPADPSYGPRERILYVFEILEREARSPAYRGCPFLATQVELKDAGHPASRVASRVKLDLEEYFTDQAELGGAADPKLLGRQLVLVFDGGSARAGIGADDLQGLATGMAATLLDAAGVR
jgi:AcrR family transcriptional regulator